MGLKGLALTFLLSLPIFVLGAEEDVFLTDIFLAQPVGVEDPLQISEPSLPELADLWDANSEQQTTLYIRCSYVVGGLLLQPGNPYELAEGERRETVIVATSVEEAYRMMDQLFFEDPVNPQRVLVVPPIGPDGNPTPITYQRIGGVTCEPIAQ